MDALEEGELEEILSSEISTRGGRYYGFYDYALRSLLIEHNNQPTRFQDISEPLELDKNWLPEFLDRKVFVFAEVNTTNHCYWIFSSFDNCQLWEIDAIPL